MNEDKSARYHRLRRRASVAGAGFGAAVLAALVASGGSASLRDLVATRTGGSPFLTAVGYLALVWLITEAVTIPLAFYEGVILERRYALSTQTTAAWWRDQLKVGVVSLLLTLLTGLVLLVLIHARPDNWWMLAAPLFTIVLLGLARLAPIMLLPLFYDIRPLDRPDLVARLLRLANRSGAPVMGVFEWRLGDRTKKGNAALTGLGGTRRILISDTILAHHSDDEIEVILAHELGHYVHHDIWKAIALEGALMTIGFWLSDVVLTRLTGTFGLTGKDDVAALPVLVLTMGALSLVMLPVANALSRAHERSADRFALETTRNATAFVNAMKRLAVQNLAEERPSRLAQWLFYSHPPIGARIDAARVWTESQS